MKKSGAKSSRWEEYKISGHEVVGKMKELIKEGNARRIIIKNEKGVILLEIPLTFGVIGTLIVPMLAAVGALGALVAKCSIVVVRGKSKKR